MSYDYTFKIIILGEGAVGKTASITRFVKNLFRGEYKVSIGVEFLLKDLEIDNKIIRLN